MLFSQKISPPKSLKTAWFLLLLLLIVISCFPQLAQAQIYNPVVGEALGGSKESALAATTGVLFIRYFVILWKVFINIGVIALLIYIVWGAFEWITAGGEKGKIESARNKITQTIIGLIILSSSFVITGFVGSLVFGTDFDILKLTFPNPSEFTEIPK